LIELWCVPGLKGSAVSAAPDLWIALGRMQAAIAGGTHDESLRVAGIGGPVSRTKRGAARLAVERLARALGRNRAVSVRKWLKSAAGLARTAVGSMVKSCRAARSSPKLSTVCCPDSTQWKPSPTNETTESTPTRGQPGRATRAGTPATVALRVSERVGPAGQLVRSPAERRLSTAAACGH
jgi:hypothetical protein